MIHKLGAAAIVLVLLPGSVRADDATAVRAAFDRYRAAVTATDGAAAATMVTAASLDHLERLRDLALAAPRREVAALPPSDRLMVLRLRHEFAAEELRPLDGAGLFRVSVDEAWSSPKTLAPLTIVTAERAGDRIEARARRADEAVPIRLVFRREGGTWKLDLVELARGADEALAVTLEARARRAAVPSDEIMRWVIEDTSGHLVDKDLWRPLDGGPS